MDNKYELVVDGLSLSDFLLGRYDDFMSGRPCFDEKFALMKADLDKTNWSGSKMAPLAANSFKPPEIVVDKSSTYRSIS